MEGTVQKAPGRIPNWAKTVVPILVSAAILYYYFRGEDWDKLYNALACAYIPLAFIGIAAPHIIFLYLDSIATQRSIEWFHGPISLRDIFNIKGASYLLSLISNPLAGGGVFVYLLRKAGISVWKLAGITLFRFGLGVWSFTIYIAIATAAAQYYDLGLEDHVNLWIWWGLIIFGLMWLAEGWVFWHHDVKILLSWIVLNKEGEFWSAFTQSRPRHWWLMWAWVTPPYLAAFIGYYAVAASFQIDVPFWKFMALIPLVLTISNLPVAFGGYGTTTLAWIAFFPEYGSREQLAAVSLFIPTARLVIRSLIGVVCLPPALKDLTKSPSKVDTDNAGQVTADGGQ